MKIIKKIICVILAFILISSLISGCSTTESTADKKNYDVPEYKYDNLARRNALSDEDKQIYDDIYTALINFDTYDTHIRLSDDIKKFDKKVTDIYFNSVLIDHPEIFWTMGESSASSLSKMLKTEYQIDFNIQYSAEEIKTYEDKLNSSIDNAIKKAPSDNASDYDKALWAYEWIINNCTYDKETLSDNYDNPLITNAYGVFCEGHSNCNGYAKAYQLLMQKFNIPCTIIRGTADKIFHAWNVIELDGKCYHVDTTWGDPVNDDSTQRLLHGYFCTDSKTILNSRTFEDKNIVPECTSSDNSFYVKNDIVIDKITNDKIVKAIEFAYDNKYKQAELKFASKDLYNKALKEYIKSDSMLDVFLKIVDDGYDFDISNGFTYTPYEDICVISIDL